MAKKLRQDGAFPLMDATDGMNKRFYAACSAMQGIISNNELRMDCIMDSKTQKVDHKTYMVEYAFELADELLKQENL